MTQVATPRWMSAPVVSDSPRWMSAPIVGENEPAEHEPAPTTDHDEPGNEAPARDPLASLDPVARRRMQKEQAAHVAQLTGPYPDTGEPTPGQPLTEVPPRSEFGAGFKQAVAGAIPPGLDIAAAQKFRDFNLRQPPAKGAAGLVGEVVGGAVSLPAMVVPRNPADALALLAGGPIGTAAKPIVAKIAAMAGDKVATIAGHQIALGAVSGSMDAVNTASQITGEEWQSDPIGALGKISAAAAKGAGKGVLTGTLTGVGHVALGGTHASESPTTPPERPSIESTTDMTGTAPTRPMPPTAAESPFMRPESSPESQAVGLLDAAGSTRPRWTEAPLVERTNDAVQEQGPTGVPVREQAQGSQEVLGQDFSPSVQEPAPEVGQVGGNEVRVPEQEAVGTAEVPEIQSPPAHQVRTTADAPEVFHVEQSEPVVGTEIRPETEQDATSSSLDEIPKASALIDPVHAEAIAEELPGPTSARKAMTTEDRAAMGLDELASPARHSWEQAIADAHKKKIPTKALDIAADINAKPRALSDTETAGLVLEATRLKNHHRATLEDIDRATDPAELSFRTAEARRVEQDFDVLTEALRKSGTEKGRALASQKLTLSHDYDLITVKARAKVAAGRALTEAESSSFSELSQKLDDANKRVSELERSMAEQSAERVVRQHKAMQRVTPETRHAEFTDLLGKVKELLKAGC